MAGYPSLTDTTHDPITKTLWGVDKSATIRSPDGVEYDRPILKFDIAGASYELYRHPEYFLSNEITAWYDDYYLCEFTKNIAKNVSAVFLDAMRIYKFYYDKFSR